jgi:long-chain acyl-CoA synthetase
MQELSRSKLYEIEQVANFKELINRSSKLYPNKIAFIYKNNPKDTTYITHTYTNLKEDMENLGTALINLGLSNKRIAIIAPNRYEWCTSYLAVTTSGNIVVPLDKALPENEIESSIIRSEVEAVIFDQKYIDTFKAISSNTNSKLKYFICMDNVEDNENILSLSTLMQKGKELQENGDERYNNVIIDNNKMTIMLFTSGTTSLAKIVMLSQANICANIYSTGCIAKVTSSDTFLSFLPLHHTYESTTTFLYGLYSGITIAFCDGLRYVSQNLKEYKVTGFVCVPLILEAMYKKIKKGIKEKHLQIPFAILTAISNFLLKFGIDIRRKLFKSVINQLGGHLRLVIYGAAPMDKSTIKGLKNIGVELLNGYGLTEASPIVSAENDKYQKPGSVAFALPNVEIRIDEPNEQGIGEIVVKGPNIMLGYYDNKEATDEVLIDGWFHTGDLGYYDKEGYLFITGRKKNVIVLKNGKNIYPEELEILVARLPYVAENMVFGKPTVDDDLEINAKIVYNTEYMKQSYPDKSISDYTQIIWNDIKELNKSMPAYKHIRNIIVTDEPMIKTTTQKVKRNEEIKKILGS